MKEDENHDNIKKRGILDNFLVDLEKLKNKGGRIMDKKEVLLSLQEMFNNNEDTKSDYTIESKQIDKRDYLTLITKDKEDYIVTDPEYDAFINLLKYHNTKDLNYVANKLDNNKVKIFTEYSAEEKDKFTAEIKDFHSRLASSNQRNIAFVELMIVDWVDKRFQSNTN